MKNNLAKGDYSHRKDGTRKRRPRGTYSFSEAAAVLGFGHDHNGASKLIRAHMPVQEVVMHPGSTNPTRLFVKTTDLEAYVKAHELEIAERTLKRGNLR